MTEGTTEAFVGGTSEIDSNGIRNAGAEVTVGQFANDDNKVKERADASNAPAMSYQTSSRTPLQQAPTLMTSTYFLTRMRCALTDSQPNDINVPAEELEQFMQRWADSIIREPDAAKLAMKIEETVAAAKKLPQSKDFLEKRNLGREQWVLRNLHHALMRTLYGSCLRFDSTTLLWTCA